MDHGKSTLSKNLNAILMPTQGDIVINGLNTKEEENLWDIRQSAGMVFQNPDNQIVATVVEEDVAFGPENLGIDPKEIRERVEESLKSVGMYELKRETTTFIIRRTKAKSCYSRYNSYETKMYNI